MKRPRQRTARLPSGALFVGRRHALAHISRAFARGDRLVTIWGAPGMGKTQLALCHGNSETTPVAFVDLTEALNGQDLCQSVRTQLGLQTPADASGAAVASAIGMALRRRGRGLLILDNFEQLVPAAAVLRLWLAKAPELRLLVTSRERLGIPDEFCLELPPLGLKGRQCEAVQLLRARAAAMGHPLSRSPAGVLQQLAERLEGLPLALELAAARLAIRSPSQLLEELSLEEVSDLALRNGKTSTASRPSALETAIAASWKLLTKRERSVLAQCSVFRGGFTLEAAEAVVGLSPAVTVPTLEALRKKALLVCSEKDGAKRFGFLLCIRSFAEARLRALSPSAAADASHGAYARHAAHFVTQGLNLFEAIQSQGTHESYQQLGPEAENLAILLREPHRLADEAQLARAVVALHPLQLARAAHVEQLEWIDRALATVARGHLLRAQLTACEGELLLRVAKYAEGRQRFQKTLTLARRLRATRIEAEALAALGRIALGQGLVERARSLSKRAVAVAAKGRHGRPERVAWITLGLAALEKRDFEQAEPIFKRVQASASAQGDLWMSGIAWCFQGDLARESGHFSEGRRCYARSIALNRGLADNRNLGVCLGQLAGLEQEADRTAVAGVLYEEALTLVGERQRRYEVMYSAGLGGLHADLEQPDQAAEYFARAEQAIRGIASQPLIEILAAHQGQMDLHRARTSHDVIERNRWLKRARARAAPFLATEPAAPFHVRMLLRALRRTQHFFDEQGVRGSLRVGPDGRSFCIPDGDPVSLLRRTALSGLLRALAHTRDRSPDHAMPVPSLLEAGWPGERPSLASGVQRVRVAIATLRGMGLERLLLTRGDGYLLDPKVPLSWAKI